MRMHTGSGGGAHWGCAHAASLPRDPRSLPLRGPPRLDPSRRSLPEL